MTSSYNLVINKPQDCEGFEATPDNIKLSNEFKATHSRYQTLSARYVVQNFRSINLMEHGADIAINLSDTRLLRQRGSVIQLTLTLLYKLLLANNWNHHLKKKDDSQPRSAELAKIPDYLTTFKLNNTESLPWVRYTSDTCIQLCLSKWLKRLPKTVTLMADGTFYSSTQANQH